jgi:hypothetical protein
MTLILHVEEDEHIVQYLYQDVKKILEEDYPEYIVLIDGMGRRHEISAHVVKLEALF